MHTESGSPQRAEQGDMTAPIETITHGETILAIIVRARFRTEGIAFLTPPSFSQQLAYMSRPAGHVIEPLHVSAASHSPAAGRHTVEAATGEHVPREPARLQASHVPALHAVLQQTPSAQKSPEVHSFAALQPEPAPFFGLHVPPAQ